MEGCKETQGKPPGGIVPTKLENHHVCSCGHRAAGTQNCRKSPREQGVDKGNGIGSPPWRKECWRYHIPTEGLNTGRVSARRCRCSAVIWQDFAAATRQSDCLATPEALRHVLTSICDTHCHKMAGFPALSNRLSLNEVELCIRSVLPIQPTKRGPLVLWPLVREASRVPLNWFG